MTGKTHTVGGVRVFVLDESGPPLRSDRDAALLLGDALAESPDWIALPVARCGDDFFELRTRVLGEVVQKFINYGLRVAFVGDVSRFAAESSAFRDFVSEANRGRQLCFVSSFDELEQRLGQRDGDVP